MSTLCTCSIASQVASLGATSHASSWADSAVLLTAQELLHDATDSSSASGGAGNGDVHVQQDRSLHASSLSLVVHRRHKLALFKFNIKCE